MRYVNSRNFKFVLTSAPLHFFAPAPTVCIAGNSFPTTLTLALISQAKEFFIKKNKKLIIKKVNFI